MEFNTVYTGVYSWCCEIAVGTKNSSLISWQVMFLFIYFFIFLNTKMVGMLKDMKKRDMCGVSLGN